MGEKGFSIFIDGTLSGFRDIRDTLKMHRIPYFNFDFSIQSFVKLLENYLKTRQGSDALVILQDEDSVNEAFHAFLSRSSLRVILMDQLKPHVIQRLRTLRPTPNYYAIIADSVNMKRLFQNVSHKPSGARSR